MTTRFAWEWHEYSLYGERHGIQILKDPTCRMFVQRPGTTGASMDDWDILCGKPATVRASRWPHWSQLWCPEHAASFLT